MAVRHTSTMTVEFQHCRCTLAGSSASTCLCNVHLHISCIISYLSAYEFTVYNATAFPAAPLKTTPFSPQEEGSKAGLFSSRHFPSSTGRCVVDADADANRILILLFSFLLLVLFLLLFVLILLFMAQARSVRAL